MISIQNLHKTFNPGSISEVYALRGIELTIQSGDFLTIIGTNGSGKSTLLNAIAGSFIADEGTIHIDGDDMTLIPEYGRARYIARVFQNPFTGTAPGMTIAENLHLAFMRGKIRKPLRGLNHSQLEFYREQVKQLEMQLEDRMDNSIGTLSGGQRQAITLLMAVLTKPKVLLLDEHTAALDPKSASQIIKLTERFIDRDQLTAVMVTHSMQQALTLGTRTIMMYKGRIIDDIPQEERRDLCVDDLLDKFAELRKTEKLTDHLLEELKKEYI